MATETVIEIPTRLNGSDTTRPKPHFGVGDYEPHYARSMTESENFWREEAKNHLTWTVPFNTVKYGGFKYGDMAWFPDGQLNASYNAVDRWAMERPKDTAIIWEADEPGHDVSISWEELLCRVCQAAGALRSLGVRKGDIVIIYLPMVPEAAIAMLACARIGALHSVVFAGFSSDSLRDRVQDSNARVVITADEGRRGGRTIATKRIVDAALKECPKVEHVLVVKRTGAEDVPWVDGRDQWFNDAVLRERTYLPPVPMNSEDPLFVLYTSGSTGKPKGIVHTTAGYILGAAMTVKHVFDVHPNDRFGCMADIGWITGHTYIVYGPLVNGTTSLIFESTPTYPTPSRYWDVVDRHRLTQFYTAPTSIRLLRRMGKEHVEKYDLSSLRTLGSVGEPINPEAWQWYNDNVGRGHCAIVDTYWMTESGSHMVSSLPGAIRAKPGSASLPFWGVEPVILDPQNGHEVEGEAEGALCIKRPFPSMARTILGDHDRFMKTYLKAYPGYFFTGDSAARDKDGYIWIKGRVDDVINVSGHRMSTAEIESALVGHPGVAETAVVGAPDEMTGQSITAFVALKPDYVHQESEEALLKELTIQVRRAIGPFATPKRIICVKDLPKTRSGKIVRRVLRKIVCGEADQLGDLSTVSDPEVVGDIIVRIVQTHNTDRRTSSKS